MTVDSILNTTTTDIELVVVDDGSIDGSCNFLKENLNYNKIKLFSTIGLGIAQARNLGASQAIGEILVFCDCHVLFPDNWLENMINTLSIPEVGISMPIIGVLQEPAHPGFCGMHVNKKLEGRWIASNSLEANLIPSEVPFIPSTCMLMRTDVFKKIGGFCNMFKPYGHEDLELSLRASLMGFCMKVNPKVKVLHHFRGWDIGRPYKIIPEEHRYNVLLMAYLHLSRDRIRDVFRGITEDLGIEKAMLVERKLFTTNVFKKRTELAKTRKHSDNWFFSKFPMY